MMERQLTIARLIAELAQFAPDTPCVAHLWVADDFKDIDPELTPDEVMETIALADQTFDADISLSLGFLNDCAAIVRERRERDE